VRLFADRAAAADPGFAVDDATVADVVEICRRLDGLPLAIELAAARLRSLPVAQIAARLDDRFRLLTGGSRAVLPRQRTLRAVVDWSWDLLSEPERAAARRLAVFTAGITPDSAVAVCAGPDVDADDVLDLLAALVDRSLLVLVDRDAPRYRMLETIREYGIERLEEAGELGTTRTAHARHFEALVDEADRHLRGPDQLTWFHRLQAERENVLAALRWLGDLGDARGALRLAVSLSWFWLLSGSPADATAAMHIALAVPGDADVLDRIIAENLVRFGDDDRDEDVAQAIKEVLDELETLDLSARPLVVAAMPVLAWVTGERERAERLFERARAHADPWVRASVPLTLAQGAENEGDLEAMAEHFDAALAAFGDLGERWGLTVTLTGLGGLRMLQDDLEGAAAALDEARALLADLGADAEHAMLHLRLADVRQRQGDLAGAAAHARQARDATDLGGVESALMTSALARIVWCLGDHDEALELIGHALSTIERVGPGRPERGHVHALVRASAAMIELDSGRPDAARVLLAGAFPAALGTEDLPIVAHVGVAVASLAAHDGDATGAAQLLGAAARLRGSEDLTNPEIARLTATLRAVLGDDGFTAAFAIGRALDRAAATARLAPA
jgi:tetratricopeptide (TPR) repeat protein